MSAGKDQLSSLDYPELIVAIAGPIGVDMDMIAASLATAFDGVGYTSSLTKLTTEMSRYEKPKQLPPEAEEWIGPDTFNTYMRKMSEANALRKHYDDPAVLSRIAIEAIRNDRTKLTGKPDLAKAKHAYIIRQLKRPEEVFLLRKIYGRQFILISAYSPEKLRKDQLSRRLSTELSTSLKPADVSYKADQLIERDAAEEEDMLGQHLRETFHLADAFIDGLDKSEMDKTVKRFVESFFGKNDISPSKDEYGMYAAKSASLRSADLSRQVGAAIFSTDGELLTQGCNEVPKAGGGSYWDTEKPDHRDAKKGFDPNEHHKREILRDLVERFRSRGYLIPSLADQNPCAHWRSPMDMIFQGRSTRVFQA